jgi:hypothetical protein
MDMIYRLPFHDWLELDEPAAPPSDANGNGIHAENEGG